MKPTTIVLSVALNVALFCVLCSLVSRPAPLEKGLIMSRMATQPVAPVRIQPRMAMATRAKAPSSTEIAAAEHKFRVRIGAPATLAAAVTACNLADAFPALAEAGQLFDFDLTLPYMATEIVVLSFFLDKLWFGPLGKLLEQRNNMLKENLESASGNLEECNAIVQFAENGLNELRTSLASEREEKLSALNAECEAAMAATKEAVSKEIDTALAGLENDRAAVLASLEKEVEGFCWEIIEKVLPMEAADVKKALPKDLFAADGAVVKEIQKENSALFA